MLEFMGKKLYKSYLSTRTISLISNELKKKVEKFSARLEYITFNSPQLNLTSEFTYIQTTCVKPEKKKRKQKK